MPTSILPPGIRLTAGIVGDGGNNEIATFTDTSNIQGEGNLTFDGTDLTIASGSIQVRTIDYSAGTLAQTIASDGGGTFAQNVTFDGDIAVNGDTITADGDLTINAASNVYIQDNLKPQADATYDLGSSGFSWRHLYLEGNITLYGTTSTGADTKIAFDGEAQDYHIGLDDSADVLSMGKGTTLGTTTAFTIGSTPSIGFFRDAGANNLISVRPGGATLTAANVEGSTFYIEQATQNFDNASSTISVQAAMSVRAQTYTGDNATLTLTEAASIYAEVPVGGSNVSIGTAYSILATGVIKCTSVTETSDIAFKENVQTIDSAIDTVKKLRPVTFDWKEDKKSAAGFIAQDVEELFPYVVDGESGNKSIKSTGILAQVTKALQESIEKIETLEKQVTALGG